MITRSTGLLAIALLSVSALAHAQSTPSTERTGRIVSGAGDIGVTGFAPDLEVATDAEDINKEITNVETVIDNVIASETSVIQTYINNFQPREEVITVTVYRDVYSSGSSGSSSSGGDDGGDDGGSDDGGGGGGCGGDG